MTIRLSIALNVCLVVFALMSEASGQSLFPSLSLGPHGELILAGKNQADEVPGMPLTTYLDPSAKKNCGVTADMIAQGIRWEPATTALGSLVDDPITRLAANKVQILVTDFGDNRNTYTSLYLPAQGDLLRPTIFLDCELTRRAYWDASIAHELTHALMASHGLEAGFEEGLAQLIEVAAGGFEPLRAEAGFKASQTIPVLFENKRPLFGHEAYAFNYLFIKYLFSRFYGWETLRAFAGITEKTGIECVSGDWAEQATCRARSSLLKRGYSSLAEKMTRPGIIRYFAVALTMNSASFPLYSIPGWEGFSASPNTDLPENVAAAQFVRVDDVHALPSLRPELEAYDVEWSNTDFKIKTYDKSVDHKRDDATSHHFLLLINTSTASLRTLTTS